jgi:Flp pilus assembly pilin Flp
VKERRMLKAFRAWFAELWNDESGHNFTEYAMLLSLIAMTIYSVIETISDRVNATFETLANKFQ